MAYAGLFLTERVLEWFEPYLTKIQLNGMSTTNIEVQCQDISLCTREPTPHDRNIVTKFNQSQHYNATLVWHGN